MMLSFPRQSSKESLWSSGWPMGRLAVLGAPQLASVRSVGGGARNAIWISMREKTFGVSFLPARSVEATVGTALLVLNALKEAR